MICYVLAMGKQHLGPHVVVGYGIKISWPGLFITSPDHLASLTFRFSACHFFRRSNDGNTSLVQRFQNESTMSWTNSTRWRGFLESLKGPRGT